MDNILRTFSVVASQRCVVVHSATLPPHAKSPVLILGSNGRIKRRKGPNEDSDPVVRVSILGNLCLSRIGSPAVPRMWKSKAKSGRSIGYSCRHGMEHYETNERVACLFSLN